VPEQSRQTDDLAGSASAVSALADPVRRALYRFVVAQRSPVGRDRVATALEVPRHSVKFHLDRLVDAGLLEVEFRRLSGRSGPGAGRPAKLYRRSSREVSVSLPARHYELAGGVLAEAVERSAREGTSVLDEVRAVAAEKGRDLVADAQATGKGADLDSVADLLAGHGYEPRVDDGELCLTNCPFDRLAGDHTDLVCGMNLALVDGVVSALAVPGLRARLAPAAGLCCVRVGR
jgi:predicted ArsR family transcriptional regulator